MHMLHKQLFISGMTCIHCQNKIEQALRQTDGIQDVQVSFQHGNARITYDTDTVSLKEIISLIEKLDYQVITKPASSRPSFAYTAGLLIVILSLYILLQRSGILNLLAPGQLADSQMSYGMLFVIGLITSVHCIAMCGGINLSQCLPQDPAGSDRGRLSALSPAFLYNLGRVISYTLTGAILGAAGILLGAGTGLSVLLQGVLKMIAGIFMIIMGVNMLGVFPWLRRFSLRMPGFLAAKIGTQKMRESRPLIVGLLNGLMPCGPLQSMQLVALASGDPLTGAISMFAFSLGTVPLMLGLGSIVALLGRAFTRTVMKIGAVLVVVLGLSMLSQGGSLSGLLLPDRLMALTLFACIVAMITALPADRAAWKTVGIAVAAIFLIGNGVFHSRIFVEGSQNEGLPASDSNVTSDGVQIVTSSLVPGRYPNITVQAGVPVKWIIDAPSSSINGCNYKMVIPEYQLEHVFTPGENTIEFTPTKTGTVSYSCWMGMIRGNIFVMAADPSAAPSTDASAAASSVDTPAAASDTSGKASDFSDTKLEPVDIPVPSGYQIPSDQLAIALPSEDENGNKLQKVSIDLTDNGFQPAVIVIQSGIPLMWDVNVSLSNAENGTQLLAPDYSTKLSLQTGENSLYLYPQTSFEVSTEDHRFYAYIKVVDDLDSIDEEAIRQEVDGLEPLIYPDSIFQSPGMSCCS